jgi:hypothetical protein
MHSSAQMARIIESGTRNSFCRLRVEEITHLKMRDQLLA